MRTIHTDNFGIYPWAMLAVAAYMFWSAYEGFSSSDGNQLGLGVGSGSLFLILALKRLRDVRQARLQGRDASIIREVTHD